MSAETDPGAEETARFSEDLVSSVAAGLNTEEQSAVSSLPSGSALLIVSKGTNAGARFLLDADSIIAGRHPNAEIFLDDVTVSRKHAEFKRERNQFLLQDLGSLNGSYYEGNRVDSTPLKHGAEIQIGKFRMTFYAANSDRKD